MEEISFDRAIRFTGMEKIPATPPVAKLTLAVLPEYGAIHRPICRPGTMKVSFWQLLPAVRLPEMEAGELPTDPNAFTTAKTINMC
jgi:hypothetical protein